MRVHSRILSAIVTALSLAMLPAHAWQSTRVVRGADGRLEYPADAAGNRIPDFSHAGYRGGGVPLPPYPRRRRWPMPTAIKRIASSVRSTKWRLGHLQRRGIVEHCSSGQVAGRSTAQSA